MNLFKLRSGRNIAGIEREATALDSRRRRRTASPSRRRQRRCAHALPLWRADRAREEPGQYCAAGRSRPFWLQPRTPRCRGLQPAEGRARPAAGRGHGGPPGVAGHRRRTRGRTGRTATRPRGNPARHLRGLDRTTGLNRWETDDAGQSRSLRCLRHHRARSGRGADRGPGRGQCNVGRHSRHRWVARGHGRHWRGGRCRLRQGGSEARPRSPKPTAQVNAAKASFERRGQEWALQRQLAERNGHRLGSNCCWRRPTPPSHCRRNRSARTQRDQAQATVEFLANKFTSAELYAWMSGILGGAYSYFLQQATAMAQLAQYQLAFERQEAPPGVHPGRLLGCPGRRRHGAPAAAIGGSRSPRTDRFGAAAAGPHPPRPVRVRQPASQAAAGRDLLPGAACTRWSSSAFARLAGCPSPRR